MHNNIITDTYLILFIGEEIKYIHNGVGQTTTFSDAWTHEEFATEQLWIDRLLELGITIED